MAQVIQFEERAVACLRERLGAAVEANEDLIAFARGHYDAVASINAAVLAAVEAATIDSLFAVVTRRWPEILGIDCVGVALIVGNRGFCADSAGIEKVEASFVDRMLERLDPVEVRSVTTGHPLFGAEARREIRAEALIRIDGPAPYPRGLLALGQRAEIVVDGSHGSGLLLFLGQIVAATIRRCVATA